MKSKLVFPLLISALFISATIYVNGSSGHRRMRSTTPRSVVASSKSFYFAVSGDSRDCGDLIMPRIAQSIERSRPQAPIEFYWHLGDLRAMLRIDCDIAKRTNPGFQCDPYKRTPTEISASEKTAYQEHAWDDFIEHQIALFGNIPFVLGVGNHELVERTRDDFRLKFR